MKSYRIGIVGGGASGVFTALRVGELTKACRSSVEIVVLEAGQNPLKKVSISGGGRCNVTHNEMEVSRLVENYPRGKKELRGPFQEFNPADTIEWFKSRGVKLHAEEDGRMFPVSNSSKTIIDCFLNESEKLKISLLKNHNVQKIVFNDSLFKLEIRNQDPMEFDFLVLATGSAPVGYRLAKGLGHKITDLAPSLFSFKISDKCLKDFPGTSFKNVSLKLNIEGAKPFLQTGPMLITHWGLSGPAVLKLSAWAAREMKKSAYKATLSVNWNSEFNLNDWDNYLDKLLMSSSRAKIQNSIPEQFTKRFWLGFLDSLEIDSDRICEELSKKERNRLLEALYNTRFEVLGKNRFKDEFVECGGVSLKEVNFKSMESKIQPNLYVTGELLDIDGITGGFNFQNAWTGAWKAGNSIANQILS